MTILVTGGAGLVGRHLGRQTNVVALRRQDLDICDATALARTFEAVRPTCVINAAAYADVNGCTRDPQRAWRDNAAAVDILGATCASFGIRLLHLSTDYVLGGPDTPGATLPIDAPYAPLSVYARSKLGGELSALAHHAHVVRIQWVFSNEGTAFVNRAVAQMAAQQSVGLVVDQTGIPTPAPWLATQLVSLARHPMLPPVLHVAPRGEATPVDWVCHAARSQGVSPVWHPVLRADLPGPPRPARSCLDVKRTEALLGSAFPHWKQALAEPTRAATG